MQLCLEIPTADLPSQALLSDREIIDLAEKGMITNFVPQQVRTSAIGKKKTFPCLSYGVSSFGYDVRLSDKFKLFKRVPGKIIDPKAFDPESLEDAPLHTSKQGSYFILPAHSTALSCTVEGFNVPNDILILALGKSTYARCSILCNVTPIEPGFSASSITLELSNLSPCDVKLYAYEGICQFIFFKGAVCKTSYKKRKGKYQKQKGITYARI